MSWRSFITPLTLYRKKTAHGTLLEVSERYGQPRLDLNGHPQTNARYRSDWNNIFKRSRIADLPSRGQALILGLGGGDVVRLLERTQPQWSVTAVELEPEVVSVANRYFGIEKKTHRSIITADAKRYIARTTNKFDLVVIDLYNGDDVPQFVTESTFLSGVARALKPSGRALFNYASHRFQEEEFHLFERELWHVFSRVTPLKTWGHTYYLAY